jgi:hypothetical protein
MSVTHPKTSFLRFILSGEDVRCGLLTLQDYFRGFNGQFSTPVLRVGAGSFLLDEEELKKYTLSCNEKPKP